MWSGRELWTLVVGAVFACACGEPPRDEMQATSGADGGPTSAATPSTSSTGGSVGTAADSSGGEIRLDVGTNADFDGGFGGSCDDVEDLPTNQGCEFWAVDLPNVSVISPPGVITPPADQQFAVVVTNPSTEVAANVEIFVGDEVAPVDSGPVPIATMRVFQLPSMSVTPATTAAGGAAYRIESDLPITAYQFQPLDNTTPVYSNDATLLFPTHVLDGDYTAITGDAVLAPTDGFSASMDNTGAFVSVVGTQDGTTISLFPTASLHAGTYTDVVIDRGEVFTAISNEYIAPSYGNLSGTRVVADAPVAVFGGSVATSEPADANRCCADHVEHQMLPLTAWGSSYAAVPAAAATGTGNDESQYRVTGAFDGTALEYDPAPPPGAPTMIDAYQTVAFVTDQPFAVRATDPEQSFAVTQFLLSNQYFPGLSRPGDPTMIVLPATDQFQKRYVFLMPQGYGTNFVTVVRPQGAELTLDEAAVPGTGFAPLGALGGGGGVVEYEYVHLATEPGSHVLEGAEPFGVIVSGHASDVSYGYAGGSGVAVISEPPPPPG